MISPQLARKVLEAGLSGGADFAEVFVEDSFSSELSISDSKPDKAMVGRVCGAGIRLFYGVEQVYVTTSDLSEKSLLKAALNAAASRRGSSAMSVSEFKTFAFDEMHTYGTRPASYDRSKKLSYLKRMDEAARQRSSLVVQVTPILHELTQKVLIANSNGLWAEDERNWVRAVVSVIVENQGSRESISERDGTLGTSEYFETINFEAMAESAVDRATALLDAEYAPAGEMPVIINAGFGGVIFHEACGHGLETTSVAKNASVFCGKLGEMIAPACVTAIDDGTLKNTWGSMNIDDEGMPMQKTVLIENGRLASYMVDQMGAKQTGFAATGSGRRQNYKFAPASRMRNTYIAPGRDKIDDMIRDIDYGLYARGLGGGSVKPGTGDYNFGVTDAFLIKNGKIDKLVKGATLIGRGIDTLSRVTHVSDDLKMETGMCGSVSGLIHTTCGQPSILVSKILVGGRAK